MNNKTRRIIHQQKIEHARQRAKERFDFILSKEERRRFVNAINGKNPNTLFLKNLKGFKQLWAVFYCGQVFPVVFSPRHSNIVTVLPENVLDRFKAQVEEKKQNLPIPKKPGNDVDKMRRRIENLNKIEKEKSKPKEEQWDIVAAPVQKLEPFAEKVGEFKRKNLEFYVSHRIPKLSLYHLEYLSILINEILHPENTEDKLRPIA